MLVVRDAKSGKVIAEGELGQSVKIGDRSVIIEQKEPAATEEKAKAILTPVVDFDDVWLGDALDYFRQRSEELDEAEDPLAKKGLNIVTLHSDPDILRRRIPELKLQNISVYSALCYTAKMTQTKAQFRDDAIVFSPAE